MGMRLKMWVEPWVILLALSIQGFFFFHYHSSAILLAKLLNIWPSWCPITIMRLADGCLYEHILILFSMLCVLDPSLTKFLGEQVERRLQ